MIYRSRIVANSASTFFTAPYPQARAGSVLEVTDQACREEIIAILLGIEETRGNEGGHSPRRLFALSAYPRP